MDLHLLQEESQFACIECSMLENIDRFGMDCWGELIRLIFPSLDEIYDIMKYGIEEYNLSACNMDLGGDKPLYP